MIVATSTITHVETVARATIAADIDYIDTQLSSPHKIKTLNALSSQIERNARLLREKFKVTNFDSIFLSPQRDAQLSN